MNQKLSFFMKPELGSKSDFRSGKPLQGAQRAEIARKRPLRGLKAEVTFLPSKGGNSGFMFSQRGIINVLAAILGLGFLVVLAFSLNALFASRTQQYPQTANQPDIDTDVVGAASFTPTIAIGHADPTEGWKNYVDTIYGYTVKYPPTWYEFAEEASYNTPPTHFFQRANPARVGEVLIDRTYVAVKVWKDSELFRDLHKGQDLSTYFEQFYTRPPEKRYPSSIEIKVENLTIDGIPAVKTVVQTPAGSSTEPAYNINIFVFREPFLYEIAAHGPGRGAVEDIEEVFTLMLQSFRLIQ